MIALFATIIPLGIAAAVKPTLWALQLLAVSGVQWWPRARALALGAAIPILFFGILGVLGFSQLAEPDPGQIDVFGVSLRMILGIGFLLASIWLLRPHPHLQQRVADSLQSEITKARVRDFFVLGLVMNAKAITTFALVLPALHDIAIADISTVARGLALLLLFALVLSPVWLPIVIRALIGQRDWLANFSSVIAAHSFRILGVMAVLAGLYLTGSAALGATFAARL